MGVKKEPLIYDRTEHGIREVPLTKKLLPVGYVAFCHPCSWATGICVGNQSDLAGRDRAQILLNNHKKSRAHIHTVK